MMMLTNGNYFTPEAMRSYWSVSQFKAFDKCPAAAVAELNGDYQREVTTPLLVGSYVDAYFTGDKGAVSRFVLEHPEITNSRTGALKADFKRADDMIDAVKRQPKMLEMLDGDKQQIFTGELFDVPWKVKLDVLNGFGIIDLKTVKDFNPVYQDGYGWRTWVEYWGYDIQGAIYQKIVEQTTGKKLPFYLVAVTKEKVPDTKILHLPQHVLDTALKIVESKIDKFDLMKTGEIEPDRCEHCDWCKASKVITAPEEYEIQEA